MHVPSLPFLPASTVFSAEIRPGGRTLDSVRVCCTPQPALGFTRFPAPGRPCGLPRPEGHFEAFPTGEYPSKLLSSAAAVPIVTAVHSFRSALRSPSGIPSRRWTFDFVPCCHVPLPRPRPQGLSPPWNPLRLTQRCRRVPLDAPMGFGSNTFRCCHALCASGGVALRFVSRLQLRVDVPSARERWRRQRFSALSGSERTDAASDPKVGRLPIPSRFAARRLLRFRDHPAALPKEGDEDRSHGLRFIPKDEPRPRLFRSPKGPASAPVNQPEGSSTVLVRCTRRHPVSSNRFVAPKSPVATQCTVAPKGWHTGGSSSNELPFRGARKHPVHGSPPSRRSLAHPKVRSSARHSRSTGSRKGFRRVEPRRATPEGIASSGRATQPPEGGHLAGSWLRSHPASWTRRPQARQTSSPSKGPEPKFPQ